MIHETIKYCIGFNAHCQLDFTVVELFLG